MKTERLTKILKKHNQHKKTELRRFLRRALHGLTDKGSADIESMKAGRAWPELIAVHNRLKRQ